MSQHLTDSIVKNLPCPPTGNRIEYDDTVKGFGVRVTFAGSRAFILNYRTRSGRERRYTIGSFPDWKTAAARGEAGELKKRIDLGEDPLADIEAQREAPTIAELCKRFKEEHVAKKRPSTRRDYEGMIDNYVLPALKHYKVAEITFSEIDGLHRKVSVRAPYRANRMVAMLSKMFNLATRWGWRTENPAKGIERNPEQKRRRYLSAAELARLAKALDEHEDKQAANIVRLLLLTGARRGEVQAMRWDQLDLDKGVWTKPGATTKQKTDHIVPLSEAARQLLVGLAEKAKEDGEYVFPGRGGEAHRVEIKDNWTDLCTAAEITTTKTAKDENGKERTIVAPSARLHDLRHTYASVLASAGLSLPVIGALLGHTQPATTHRYAHLFDDPLRAATERAAAIVTGKPRAEIVQLAVRKS
jgi:integrase